jgi:hypothetical protein
MRNRFRAVGLFALASILACSASTGAASAYPVSNIKISMPANPSMVRDCQKRNGNVVRRSSNWICERPRSEHRATSVVIDPTNGKGRPNRH